MGMMKETSDDMGFDLIGLNGGQWGCNFYGWGYLLKVAQAHGWEPMGTQFTGHSPEADPDEEPGPVTFLATRPTFGYNSNDWQTVVEEDAKNLAAALDRALKSGDPLRYYPDNPDEYEDPDDARGGWDMRQLVTELADLARRGPFLIG
jgi:hypothetical protein